MSTYNIVASANECTVVTEYVPEEKRSTGYQSEADLEKDFIRRLCEQGYERLTIHSEPDLIINLRKQIEALNDYKFTDNEWDNFFRTYIANANEGIVEKTRTIQEDHIKVLIRDNGSSKNIMLLDKKDILNNRLQVVNQYEVSQTEGARHDNRYDVTILVNGLPLVHIELKRRGVAIREAFNQINRYQRDSFWSGSGLYEYVQIFIISNGTHTKYYSNTTRNLHIKEHEGSATNKSGKKTSNSFEFTSFWADGTNRVIPDLVDFTRTFLCKHTLLNVLTKYCVFTSENILMVMRPYQIAATERILNKIEISTNYRKYGTINGGGYIWHTTGSGKTLTSFKTAQLASRLPYIDKVLFVVDRKDLDYQTMKEYDRFEKGAANSNSSTSILTKQLNDENARIIITTIQKLDTFIKKNSEHDIYNKHVVIIFDECHRSQFGNMHLQIIKHFKKYHIFGFTGTPIFAENAGSSSINPALRTTEQIFGDKLHTYTIIDAINDQNVLPFRVDYIQTMSETPGIIDKNVPAIDRERALKDPRRIAEITEYILTHFAQKTKRRERYTFTRTRNIYDLATARNRNNIVEDRYTAHVTGFNSILAVDSIDMAKLYYAEFKKRQAELPEDQRLVVALIYSYGVNEADDELFLDDENCENTNQLDASSRDFLENAILDYNERFHTLYSTEGDSFQNYYKDVSLRMKNKEIDILIVVNMFLTGFDATTLNTLWVDKNLRYHGLLQAYSRTNRILNSIKRFGNIVCFRDLEENTNKALALFGNRDAHGIVLLRDYHSYYYGYDENGKHHDGYIELVAQLRELFPISSPIIGKRAQEAFIALFGRILRLRNILSTFDEFAGNELFTEREYQDYQSIYIDLYQQYKEERETPDREVINEDLVFEIELVKQVEVDIDYILELIKKYQTNSNTDVLVSIDRAIQSSIGLRSKVQLIHAFIDTVSPSSDVDKTWLSFIEKKRKSDLNNIIAAENLKPELTYQFMNNAFRDGLLKTTGTDIDDILPPVSRFGGGNRTEKKNRVIDLLTEYFELYVDICNPANTLSE